MEGTSYDNLLFEKRKVLGCPGKIFPLRVTTRHQPIAHRPTSIWNCLSFICSFTSEVIGSLSGEKAVGHGNVPMLNPGSISAGLGPSGVDEAQAAPPKNCIHNFGGLMDICWKKELRIWSMIALQPQVREEVVHAEMTGIVLGQSYAIAWHCHGG